MIRMGLFLTIIMVTVNAGLFLTGDLTETGAFSQLSTALNDFTDVDAQIELSGLQSSSGLAAADIFTSFIGYVNALKDIAIAGIKIIVFLLTGSIQIIEKLDTTGAWGLVILAPIAVFQIFYIMFFLITIAAALLGSLRGIT